MSDIFSLSEHIIMILDIRVLNSFSDVVCLKLLGIEFYTLGPVYLIDCFPKAMVVYICIYIIFWHICSGLLDQI